MADDLRSWFPLYVADMLNSRKVRKMDAQDFGIFMFLLLEQWIGGPLPEDKDDLLEMAKCASWPKVEAILQAQFVMTDRGWVNERLVEIWKEQDAKIRRKSRAGKAGAEARWGKPVLTVVPKDPPPETEVEPVEDGNRIPSANADAVRSQSDTNGNESRGEEKRVEKKVTSAEPKPRKRGRFRDDRIYVQKDLAYGDQLADPANCVKGYNEVPVQDFIDMAASMGDETQPPVSLVIETQEHLDAWLGVER